RKFWTDRFNYLILKFLFDAPDYQRLRKRTTLNRDLSLAATEQFGKFLMDHLSVGRKGGKGRKKAKPGSTAGKVEIDGVAFAERVQLGNATKPGEFGKAVLVLAKEIEDAQDGYDVLSDLARSWGSGPGSLQQLPYETRADLARRIAQNEKLRRLAEIV